MKIATEASAEMDGLFAGEQAAKAERRAAVTAQRQEADEAVQGEAAATARDLATAGERGA